MRYYFQRAAIVLTISLIWVLSAQCGYAEESNDTSIIAVVNGESISYKEIKVVPEFVQLNFQKKLNPSQMEVAVHEFEMDRLAAMIREKIRLQKIHEAGLTVSEQEIDRALDKMFEAGKIDEKIVKEISTSAMILADALEAWQKDPTKGDIIYEEMLSSAGTSKREWKTYQITTDTPEKLAKFRALIPYSVADMKRNSRDSKKRKLMHKKFQMKIVPNVTVTNKELEAEYEQRYAHLSDKPSFKEIKNELYQELLLIKRNVAESKYWLEQFKKAKIEIRSEKFKDVLDLLIDL